MTTKLGKNDDNSKDNNKAPLISEGETFSDVPAQIVVPELPIDGLPPELQEIINEYHEVYGTHRDFWAAAVIGAIGLAAGNSIILDANNYKNTACLWLIFVADSGIGKSEPWAQMLAPFIEIDKKNYVSFKEELRHYNTEIRKYHALKPNEKSEIEPPTEPQCKQRILNDTTPEKLVELHETAINGICLNNDEFHSFILRLGRYTNNAELQSHMEAWNGKPFVINRVKRKEPLRIDSPFIAHYGTTQPEIIPEFGKDLRDKNGYTPRCCWVYPDNPKKKKASRKKLDYKIREHWTNFLEILIDYFTGLDTPKIITLTREAEKLYFDFLDKNAEIINNEKVKYHKATHSKLEIMVLRFAIICHVSHFYTDTEIKVEDQVSSESIKCAIDIVEYFRLTAIKTYNGMKSSTEPENKTLIHQLSTLGHSQNKIAEIIGVSQPYVNKILKNF